MCHKKKPQFFEKELQVITNKYSQLDGAFINIKLPVLGRSACWLIAHVINSSSITMLGIWAILGHSSPFSLSHRCFRRGQPSRIREEREVGKPSSGKYWRLLQSKIIKVLREVRCWKPLSDFRFGKLAIEISVRVGGSNASSGKDSTSLQLLEIRISLREWRTCDPHPVRLENSLSHCQMLSLTKFKGKPPLGNDSSSGHSLTSKISRDGSRVHIFLGNDFNLEQSLSRINLTLGGGIPPLKRDTKLGDW